MSIKCDDLKAMIDDPATAEPVRVAAQALYNEMDCAPSFHTEDAGDPVSSPPPVKPKPNQ